MRPKVAFTTLGCKVNQAESETLLGLFLSAGYEAANSTAAADVYVINTCSVTNLSERKSRQMIRRLSGKNPDAVVVVTGCYAQAAAAKIAAIPGVDLILGAKEKGRVVELVNEARENKGREQKILVAPFAETAEFDDIPLLFPPERTRAFLKIQDGCENFCTYCIVPRVRGPLRSRPLHSILTEAAKLVAAGFKEIVLTGIHLGAYGRDLPGTSLTDAAAALLNIKELPRLRLSSLEGVEVSDNLIKLMQENKRFCPHFHLPLQAGDDTVLKAMNRQYTTSYYRETAAKIRKIIPGVAITTDIIAGFPGESEENFRNTLDFAQSMNFARAHIFPYSKRKGTPAANYPCQIGEKEKKRRAQILQQLSLEVANRFQASFVGEQTEILVENCMSDIVGGLTGNYLRVYAAGESRFVGKLKTVVIEKFEDNKLWGKIIN